MRERVVTEESMLAVLDILADEWPLYASEVGWRLYPDSPDRWATCNGTGALKILRALQSDGMVKPWSIKGRSVCWAPATAPDFVELYKAMVDLA